MKLNRYSGRARQSTPQLSGKDNMHCEIRQRDNGTSLCVATVEQFVATDGTLRTCIYDVDNNLIYEYQTVR